MQMGVELRMKQGEKKIRGTGICKEKSKKKKRRKKR